MHPLKNDEHWMQRALELAALGRKTTLPNPMVGCVIVVNDAIVAEGWHMRFGKEHAEVNALNQIPHLTPALLSKATAYVSLEPCSHFGKTPPCADLLISRGIGRVVTAMEDPNPDVSGRGHKKLLEAGIKVESGVCEKEALDLNRKFIALQSFKKPRPYVILKWAQSSDGFIDPEVSAKFRRGSFAITGGETKEVVHRLRSENNGILIGHRTAAIDNPSLTVRSVEGVNPIRIILDPELKLDISGLQMADQEGVTLILCREEPDRGPVEDGVKILPWLDLDMEDWLGRLRVEEGVNSLLVEGGAATHSSFLESGVYDEIVVFTSPIELHTGLPAPLFPNVDSGKVEISQVGKDVRKHYIRTC